MWECPACKKENKDTDKYCGCGFERAQNYQEVLFFTKMETAECKELCKKLGTGTLILEKGEVDYKGDIVFGKMTGHGKHILASGSIQEGEFVDGKKVGLF